MSAAAGSCRVLARATVATVLRRHYHPPKGRLSTKKSVHKRFELKPNGRIKYWPSQLSGKSRTVTPRGNMKHIAALLLPAHGNRSKW